MNASLSINLNNNQPYAVGNDNYYDDDGGTDSYDSFRTPPRAPPLPVTAAPAPLYDSSEMVVGGSYKHFNPVQSECFNDAYHTDRAMAVAAPTGSGKTLIAELAILRLFRSPTLVPRPKAVYLAPLRALCDERRREWQALFAPLQLTVALLTGDTEPDRDFLYRADILVTTPEKWDGVTRRRDVMAGLVEQLGLICIDEVHLLNEKRGACLEGIVSRCRLLQTKMKAAGSNAPIASLRLIALSATVKNVDDLGEWLGDSDGSGTVAASVRSFDMHYRPVPLQYHVNSYAAASNPYLFDRSLDYKISDVVWQYSLSEDRQTRLPSLVFCCTRNGTAATARLIIQECRQRNYSHVLLPTPKHKADLATVSSHLTDTTLASLVRQGVGFHHGGLAYEDRMVIEQAFVSSQLLVLCTTSTLALGVNLPAHLVVVKSTKYYERGHGWRDYDASTILQMTGRAGRPQFDSEAVAVVMCEDSQRQFYEEIMCGMMPIESNFSSQLIEHLNSEVVSQAVTSLADALTWLQHSFLYIRIRANPFHYGISNAGRPPLSPASRDGVIRSWLVGNVEQLKAARCISEREGGRLVAEEKGRVMNIHYLSFHTILLFDDIDPPRVAGELYQRTCTFPHLLYLFSKAAEFSECRIRQGEKTILNSFIKPAAREKGAQASDATQHQQAVIPFQLPNGLKGVKETEDKIYVLSQAILIGRQIPDGQLAFNLRQDVEAILGQGVRVSRAIEQYAVNLPLSSHAIRCAVQLRRDLSRRRLHTGDQHLGRLLTQLQGVGPVYAQQLAAAGLGTFDKLRAASVQAMEQATKAGERLKSGLSAIPKYQVHVAGSGATRLDVTVKQLQMDFVAPTKEHNCMPHHVHLIVGRLDDGRLLLYRKVRVKAGCSEQSFSLGAEAMNSKLRIDVVDDIIVGVDVIYRYEGWTKAAFDDDDMYGGLPLVMNAPQPLLVEATDEDDLAASAVASSSTAAGSPVCQHKSDACMRCTCNHKCCQQRAERLGLKRGELVDEQQMEARQSSRYKAQQPLLPPKRKPFQPPKPLTKPKSEDSDGSERQRLAMPQPKTEVRQAWTVQPVTWAAERERQAGQTTVLQLPPAGRLARMDLAAGNEHRRDAVQDEDEDWPLPTLGLPSVVRDSAALSVPPPRLPQAATGSFAVAQPAPDRSWLFDPYARLTAGGQPSVQPVEHAIALNPLVPRPPYADMGRQRSSIPSYRHPSINSFAPAAAAPQIRGIDSLRDASVAPSSAAAVSPFSDGRFGSGGHDAALKGLNMDMRPKPWRTSSTVILADGSRRLFSNAQSQRILAPAATTATAVYDTEREMSDRDVLASVDAKLETAERAHHRKRPHSPHSPSNYGRAAVHSSPSPRYFEYGALRGRRAEWCDGDLLYDGQRDGGREPGWKDERDSSNSGRWEDESDDDEVESIRGRSLSRPRSHSRALASRSFLERTGTDSRSPRHSTCYDRPDGLCYDYYPAGNSSREWQLGAADSGRD